MPWHDFLSKKGRLLFTFVTLGTNWGPLALGPPRYKKYHKTDAKKNDIQKRKRKMTGWRSSQALTQRIVLLLLKKKKRGRKKTLPKRVKSAVYMLHSFTIKWAGLGSIEALDRSMHIPHKYINYGIDWIGLDALELRQMFWKNKKYSFFFLQKKRKKKKEHLSSSILYYYNCGAARLIYIKNDVTIYLLHLNGFMYVVSQSLINGFQMMARIEMGRVGEGGWNVGILDTLIHIYVCKSMTRKRIACRPRAGRERGGGHTLSYYFKR